MAQQSVILPTYQSLLPIPQLPPPYEQEIPGTNKIEELSISIQNVKNDIKELQQFNKCNRFVYIGLITLYFGIGMVYIWWLL